METNRKIKQITIEKSTAKNKKLKAIIEYETGRNKTVNFGDSRYEDFTIHHDEKRKKRYIDRH